MAETQVFAELAAGTPPAPARVVVLDAGAGEGGVESAAAELAAARAVGDRATLVVTGLDFAGHPERLGITALAALGERLGEGAHELALALPGTVAHPEELALEAGTALRGHRRGPAPADAGPAPLYLLLPAGSLEAVQRRRSVTIAGGREMDARRWWEGLLALAATAPFVSLVPGVPGPGLSLLAPRGRWAGPSPGLGELIPAEPRRLRLDLDFAKLLAVTGDRPEALAQVAGRLVVAADDLLGPLAGPRRLAIRIAGIGRAVRGAGRDPGCFGTLRWLNQRLAAFRDGARAASVRLARSRGHRGGLTPFPLPGSLEVAEAGALDKAVLRHGARHSHLVCLSPFDLAPPELGRDGLDLLPALACADSVAWRRPAGGGEDPGYGERLRFAWAVAQRH